MKVLQLEVDFRASDSSLQLADYDQVLSFLLFPITEKESKIQYRLESFPLVAAAVAIVFNLPELSTHVIAGGTLRLERETLASIFSGDIEW